MDQNKPEPTLEESIKQVMQTLPPVIRDYLAQGRYTPVAKSLMMKYALRIDQGGVLERELMLLLMGIENPDEFTKALAEDASLSQQVVSGIVQDVNAQIFVPLREEMKKTAGNTVRPASVIPKAEPQTQTPPRFFHLENKLAARGAAIPPRPVQQPAPGVPTAPQPKPVLAQPSPLATVIGNVLNAQSKVVPQPPRPSSSSNIAPLPPKFMSPKSWGSQTPPEPRKMLEDHEELHIEFKKPQTPPPANLPGTMPPLPVPSVQFSPTPTAPIAPATPIKSYTIDPYREPIE